MDRWRTFLSLFLVLVASACAKAQASDAKSARRPNLIVLLADDLRWDSLGCVGNPLVQSPHLDALAKKGVRFKNAFVTTSICAVSRASILSGQFAHRHQIHDFQKAFTPEQWAQTYVALLRGVGYRVGFIGKFGVGAKMPADAFHYWKGFGGQGQYFPKDGDPRHMNQRMGDQTLEFLRGCDPATPFCLSISFKCPHAQDNAKREFPPDPRDEGLYKDTTFPMPKTAAPEFFAKLPKFVQESEGNRRWKRRYDTPEKFQEILRDYHRLVTGMDREIGRLLAELERTGVLENTVIVFLSDNGFFFGERGMADKWLMYEESIRVPMIVFDPALPMSSRGKTLDAMALNIDVAPTLLDYAGVKTPSVMQGKSLRSLVEGKSPTWRTDFFYQHLTLPKIIPPVEGVRTERWSYMRWVNTEPVLEELYDLPTDPLQERDLSKAPSAATRLAEMRARWAALRKEAE